MVDTVARRDTWGVSFFVDPTPVPDGTGANLPDDGVANDVFTHRAECGYPWR